MYSILDYYKRGIRFANNIVFSRNKKISTLMIYATDSCDSICKHCNIWAKNPVCHISYEKIMEIMKSKCVNKNTLVGLEGGEFLLHPEADKILKWFSKNHPNFDLLSNCLEPFRVIDAVKRHTPKHLYLSLDGDKDTYKYMRGKDGYNSVLKVINECKDLVPISAMFTLSPYNSFNDLEHVIGVCKEHNIDVRIGVYNDIKFFDTTAKAHETGIAALKNKNATNKKVSNELINTSTEKKEGLIESEDKSISTSKYDELKLDKSIDFKKMIPVSVKETTENYDFLLLYDEWKKKNTKLKCFSILDSIVIHPNGNVPICQNLGVKLGNVNEKSLDEIFNSLETIETHKKYTHNCNQCWVNFHRKYDIVLLRSLEKLFPKWLIQTFYGKYQWTADPKITYKQYIKKNN